MDCGCGLGHCCCWLVVVVWGSGRVTRREGKVEREGGAVARDNYEMMH